MLIDSSTSHLDINKWKSKTLDVFLSLGIKETKAIKKIDTYYQEVMSLTHYQFKFTSFNMDNLTFPLSELRKRVGRIKTTDGLAWVSDLIHKHSPLFIINKRGNNITKKMSKINASRIFEVSALLDKTPKEVWDTFKDDWVKQPSQLHEIEINTKSLKNFIDYTYHNYQQNGNTKLRDDLLVAIPLLRVAEHNNGIVPHTYTIANSGRIYYTGLNLLTAPRTVRHAALAPCYEIDIENCAWQWKAHIGRSERLQTDYLDLYCADKKAIREGLAADVFQDNKMLEQTRMKQIKTALSAMGFGAQTPNGHISSGLAIKEAFSFVKDGDKKYNNTARDRFSKHEFVVNLQKESRTIDKELVKKYRKQYEHLDFLKTEKGHWSTSRFIAYLYQSKESELMNSILAESYLKEKTIIRIHDAIYGHYTKDDVRSIQYIIGHHGFKISVVKHDKWTKSLLGQEKHEYEQFTSEHKQRIAHEEQQAIGHYTQPIKIMPNSKSTGDELIEHLERTDPTSELLQDLKKQKADSMYNKILSLRE